MRKSPPKPETTRWAYRVASLDPWEIRDGLEPVVHRWYPEEGPVIFFGESPSDVWSYFGDREDGALLRFPWPADAKCGEQVGHDCVTRRPIPASQIERYIGSEARRAADCYGIGDSEDRVLCVERKFPSRERLEQPRMWRKLGRSVG